ncbi:Bromodomain and PHD finger-containing protein [Drosera capensis]
MGKTKTAAAAPETMKNSKRRKKKKRGRPPLLRLSLKKSPNEDSHFPNSLKNPNLKSNHHRSIPPRPIPIRRFTRRNRDPSPEYEDEEEVDVEDEEEMVEEEDEDEDEDERREKKVKLVRRLPPSVSGHPKSPPPRTNLSSSPPPPFNAISSYNPNVAAANTDPYTFSKEQKGRWKTTGSGNGSVMELSGPTATPLLDKKLLLFILDKLQKKDTRGAFAEPVDPEELPDYHEVIEKPMDFGTVRKKLDEGIYFTLEQFEADVNLICSNAMEYNASHTIYFRQARSIKELAKVEFENLRQCGNDAEQHAKPYMIEQPLKSNIEQQLKPNIQQQPKPEIEQALKPRRGRPPGSTTKRKAMENSSADHVSKSFPASGALSSEGDDGSRSGRYNLRKGPSLPKFHPADGFSRASYASRQFENYSAPRMSYMKGSRLQFDPEESRRGTYMQPADLSRTDSLSTISSIWSERQPLLRVGLHTDHGYAWSLARFAANLGPVAWKIASKKIRTVLPPGVEFGPGWVGESNASSAHQPVPLNPLSLDTSQCNPYAVKSSYPSTVSSAALSHKPTMINMEDMVDARAVNAQRESTVLNGVLRGPGLQTPYWTQDWSVLRPGMNGISGGFELASLEEARPGPSSINTNFVQGPFACHMPSMITGSTAKPSPLADSYQLTRGSTNPGRERPSPMDYWTGMDAGAGEPGYQGRPFWPEVSAQERWVSSSIQGDKTGGFQVSSSHMLEIGSSPQLDLMLQL